MDRVLYTCTIKKPVANATGENAIVRKFAGGQSGL
jgi:hypothetical protein